MNEHGLPIAEEDVVPLNEIAPGVAGLRILFVNVFGISNNDGSWTLIDTGIPMAASRIRKWAEETFGNAPASIVLTHGHFDHAGSAKELADHWNVPIFAHSLEAPFLDGRQHYPPPDPSVGGGVMATLSPLYPKGPMDLGTRLRTFSTDGALPTMPGWKLIHTPGHTVGHVSFFRESDRVLLVGDAFCTVKSESLMAIAKQTPELHGPPAYYTPDWTAAKHSVDALAALEPDTLAPGHGQPLAGSDIAGRLRQLSARFEEIALPQHAASNAN